MKSASSEAQTLESSASPTLSLPTPASAPMANKPGTAGTGTPT
jgi:hypothetical protein